MISQEQYDGFWVDNIRMGTGASGSLIPYDHGCFWASASEQNTGSGYALWTVVAGKLEKLNREESFAEVTASEKSVVFKRADEITCFVDPFDGETVYAQMPEGWESFSDHHWYRSYDGRMLYAAMRSSQGVFSILVFDGRTNRLYEINRPEKPIRYQTCIEWSHDNRLVIYTESGKEISVYTFE